MHRSLPALLLLTLSAAAPAAERKLFLSSFDRVRVEGPFRVTVAAGRTPGGTVSGDGDQLDGLEVRQEGSTLAIRRPLQRWRAQAAAEVAQPITVALTTPALSAINVIGAGEVTASAGKASRLDLSVAGTGAIAATGIDAAEVNATSIGNGRITLAGRAARAKLVANGAGAIQAEELDASEVTVLLDGPGEATARARYTANVTNTGLGHVVILGSPKCAVKAAAGGPVSCGSDLVR